MEITRYFEWMCTLGMDLRIEDLDPKGNFNCEKLKSSEIWSKRIVQNPGYPKRKYALAVGYSGTGYQGLQINPGAITVG